MVERRRSGGPESDPGKPLLDERVININRVAKVVKGGRRFSFSALVVVGDGQGRVGVGYGKAREVPLAIQKGVDIAKRTMFEVPRIGGTIPHEVMAEDGAGRVLLKPAAPGTGVIAGGSVRAVMECAGITDVLSKSLGSENSLNIVHATIAGLRSLRRPEDVARRRGRSLEDVAPRRIVEAIRAGEQAASRAAAGSAGPGAGSAGPGAGSAGPGEGAAAR